MKNPGMMAWACATMFLAAVQGVPQDVINQGQGQAIVTVLPKKDGAVPASVTNQDLSVKLNGKNVKVTKWAPYKDPDDSVEVVVLIDGSARSSLGGQVDDIARFIKNLPPNAKAAIAYMDQGRAVFSAPLSADHAQVLSALHMPGGSPGSNASPYFCLSDLAKRWPSQDRAARREVVMITDGVDNFERQYNPDDPNVQAAMTDSARAGLVVYSIYWKNQGRADETASANDDGQNLLSQVTQATGGKSFWEGMGNPVSLGPYFDELARRLQNQYELRFVGPLGGKPEVENFRLKLSAPGTEIDSPQQVLVYPASPEK